MIYEVRFTKSAKKDFENLPLTIKPRIIRTIDIVAANPFLGKSLKAQFKNYLSYRVGEYRIIYKIFKKEIIIIVLRIRHRRKVYSG